ncbi:MAG: JAB domain-containing protein [Candidatus Omnitrophica bacterium]|nr:JAB domain-containing protein [Candidatus Omnitrophota bacterium]MCB9747953.1 JAB domain-containing protein [Candidatus Omnitrophota bacterium]
MEIKLKSKEQVVSSESIKNILGEILKSEDPLDQEKEHFWAIGLDAQNHIKYIDLVHLGAINQCPCHVMEIYRRACIKGIVSLIVAHNHPSGNPQPSREDIRATEKLKQAGDILGIKLLDHVIIADNSYYSFCDDNNL